VHPILFELQGFPIGTYALAVLLALVVAVAVSSWLAGRDGHDRGRYAELCLWAFVVAILVSKVFGAVVGFDPEHPKRSIVEVLRFGGHFYAGGLATIAFLVVGFRRAGIPVLRGFDALAVGVAFGHVLGRLGCLMAGCCWGAPCDLPWAITFTSARAHDIVGVPLDVALHPTQVYEMLVELAIGAHLLWIELKSPSFAGRTLLRWILLYGTARFFLELLRGDPRGTVLGLSTSQAIAVVTVLAAAALHVILSRRSRPSPATRTAERLA
jgi:phosphatidylglycerol:prolipoprotein diacylglycerol transferase